MTASSKYRLLCMDGGGIYGYFTVLMLKHFAEKYPKFLDDGQLTAFGGTSAGALISLLLAKEKKPRDFLLSGALEEFFASDLLHGNKLNPVESITSLMGLTSWCGGKDMEKLLKDHLGDMTLGDLPNKVLIMTFDLSGKTWKKQTKVRGMKTKVYHNFYSKGNDLDVPAWFVAYGAACPATVRPVLGGISDGAIFAMSPTISAISQLINIARLKTSVIEDHVCKVRDLYKINEGTPEGYDIGAAMGMPMGMGMGLSQNIPVVLPENVQVDLDPDSLVVRLLNDAIKEKADVDLYNTHLEHLRTLAVRLRRTDCLITQGEYLWALSGLSPVNPEATDLLGFLDSMRISQVVELRLLELLDEVVNDPLKTNFGAEEVDEDAVSYDPGESQEVQEMRLLGIWSHARVCLQIKKVSSRTHPYLRTLDNIQALSLGVGCFVPHYARDNINLGFANFNLFPTNPGQNVWTPPALHLMYSPSTDHTDYEATQFLGDNYHRCTPKAISWPVPPVVASLYLSRYRPWREFILNGIRSAFNTCDEELEEACKWLEDKGWG